MWCRTETFFLLCLVLVDSVWGLLHHTTCRTPSLKYGRVRSRQRGRIVKFICNPDYELTGARSATCTNGSWGAQIPKCVRGTCPKKVTTLQNGGVLPFHNGGMLNFYCLPGYELNGPSAIYCDGYTWDNQKPSCIPSKTKPQLFCDFEDVGLCHWKHDLNHDMDWVRDSYKTPTGYSMPTGPSFDHTKGNGSNGYYMYIESSSRRPNDTARLISPIFANLDGRVCLEFWYHMYGKTTGTLRAYLKKLSDPWPLRPSGVVFKESGNHGNVWLRALVDLGIIREGFQIIMEGVRGNGYVGDLAVDDIKIIPNCIYDDLVYSTTETIPSVSDVLKTMESCENRCGQKAFGNESSQVVACDCDDFCYDTSRCCQDYIDFCLPRTLSTDWTTVTEDYTSTPETTTIRVKPKTTTKLKPTTVLQRKPPQKITVPPLIILQPPTTPEVVRKILPLGKNASSRITFQKPKPTQTTAKTIVDDFTVPHKNFNDEELLLTSPLPPEEDSNDINDVSDVREKEDYVEKAVIEKDYPFKVADPVGEFKTEFQEIQEDSSNSQLVLIVSGTVCGIVLVGFVVGVVWDRTRAARLRGRRITSGQGDSQSDVRFLTADEVLDFNLDNDYEDL